MPEAAHLTSTIFAGATAIGSAYRAQGFGRDILGRTNLTAFGTPDFIAGNAAGPALGFNGSTSYMSATGGTIVAAYPQVIGLLFSAPSFVAGGNIMAVGAISAAANDWYIAIGLDSTNHLRGQARGVTATGQVLSTKIIRPHTPTAAVLVVRSATSYTLCTDGEAYLGTTNAGAFSQPLVRVTLGGLVRNSGLDFLSGTPSLINFAFVSKVDLGDEFYKSWTRDPWALFADQNVIFGG